MEVPVSDDRPSSAQQLLRTIGIIQGTYYTVTGVLPLINIRSFQFITGPKRDLWLVKTAGALIGVVGATLAFGSKRAHGAAEMPLLGAGSAVALATIDIVYYRRGTLRSVYLADAASEVAIVTAWLVAFVSARRQEPS